MASTSSNIPDHSIKLVDPPFESVSSLCFSPKHNHLVATSWDKQVRCWEVTRSGNNVQTFLGATMSHDQPVLCSAWKDDGQTVFTGGCDNQVRMWTLGAPPVTLGVHDAPVKDLAWIPEMNALVTGSWDSTLRYWDMRSQHHFSVPLPDRCYALSVKYPLMVVGTADRNIVVYNLQNFQAELHRIISPLQHQTRCVALFPDKAGFVVGSIEGRIAVHYFNDEQSNKNHTFTCHRKGNSIYSVNSLNFHPVYQQTFASAGSDGSFIFRDKDLRRKLRVSTRCRQPIPCSTFNNDGSIYAYAACYDWHKGAENHNPAAGTSIYLHLPQEGEVKAGQKSEVRESQLGRFRVEEVPRV